MKDRLDLLLQPAGRDRLRDPVGDGRNPENSAPPPCGFGISTASTGGGKYLPDDIRFQILYSLFFRSFSNSSIETHPLPAHPCWP